MRYAAHEAFLDLLVGPGDRERGLAIYRDLREKEPREAAWPYLMACLSNRIREREPLLRESLAGDAPPNVWHLQAATQASAGAWEAALASADSALEPESSDGRSLYLRFDALGALQRNEDLDQQLRAVLEASPSDCNSALRLLERLPRGTSDAEVVQQLAELQQRARKLSQPVQPESIVFLHAWTAFVLGDLPALEQLDRVTRDQSLRWLHASLLADMGRLPELRLFLEGRQRCQIEPYDALAIALACRAGGEDAQAELWEQRALPGLSAGIDLETARLLGGSRRSVADEALDLALPPWRKAVVLGLLSFSDKAQRVRLLQAAVRLQSRPIFPRRVLEELASKSVPR